MQYEAITAEDARQWLNEQSAIYASCHGRGSLLRLTCWPTLGLWKVTEGVGTSNQILYAGGDLDRAVEVYNENQKLRFAYSYST